MPDQDKKNKYAHAKYRLFGGRTYMRAFHFANKQKAEYYAKEQRLKGIHCRIVKEVGGYVAYKRNPNYA